MAPEVYGEGEVPLLRLIPLVSRIIGVNAKAKEYELTKSQLMFMTALYYRGVLNMTRVAEYISSSKEQATRVVAPLVEKGIVRRKEDTENRTHVFIEFTQKGLSLMEALREETHRDINLRLGKSLNDEEMDELTAAVRTVVSLLKKVE